MDSKTSSAKLSEGGTTLVCVGELHGCCLSLHKIGQHVSLMNGVHLVGLRTYLKWLTDGLCIAVFESSTFKTGS